MGRAYNAAHYQVEQIVTFPGIADLSDAAGNVSKIAFQEAIEIIEFGTIVVTEVITAKSVCTLELREGGTVLASIIVTSVGALGILQTTRTVTANVLAAGGDLIFYRNITTTGLGESQGYVKFRYRYV